MILVNVLQAYSARWLFVLSVLPALFGNVCIRSHEPTRFTIGLILLTVALLLVTASILIAWQKFIGFIQVCMPWRRRTKRCV